MDYLPALAPIFSATSTATTGARTTGNATTASMGKGEQLLIYTGLVLFIYIYPRRTFLSIGLCDNILCYFLLAQRE